MQCFGLVEIQSVYAPLYGLRNSTRISGLRAVACVSVQMSYPGAFLFAAGCVLASGGQLVDL